jgi:hypothetical protein
MEGTMASVSKGRISFALILIGAGAWFLAINLLPDLQAFSIGKQTWPLQVVGVGAFMALIGLLTWTPGWFIPAAIVAGIGGLLVYQNATGDWASWSYAWTLIPGFVSVGLALFGLLTWRRGPMIAAGWTMFSSLVLFGIFGATLGRLSIAGIVAPAAVILLGLMVIISAFVRGRGH